MVSDMKKLKFDLFNRLKKVKSRSVLLLITPNLLGWLAFFGIPFLVMFILSFMDSTGSSFCGFENYINVLSSKSYGYAMRNIFLLQIIGIISTLCISIPLACFLYFQKISQIFKYILVLPLIIPAGVTAGLMSKIVINLPVFFKDDVGILFVVVLLFMWRNFGLTTLIFFMTFSVIPKEIVESARVDGAKNFEVAKYILLPESKSVSIIAVLFLMIGGFKLFRDLRPVFTDYPENPWLYTYQNYMNNVNLKMEFEKLYASAIIFCLLVLVMILVITAVYRYFNRGIFYEKLSKNTDF